MKTDTTLCPPDAAALPMSRSRWLDFVELTKPRIALLVLFTVAIGAMLASPAAPDLWLLFNTVAGTALVAAVRAGELDALHPPVAPLDLLAQQIVAEVSAQEWREDELFALVRRARPFRELDRRTFD